MILIVILLHDALEHFDCRTIATLYFIVWMRSNGRASCVASAPPLLYPLYIESCSFVISAIALLCESGRQHNLFLLCTRALVSHRNPGWLRAAGLLNACTSICLHLRALVHLSTERLCFVQHCLGLFHLSASEWQMLSRWWGGRCTKPTVAERKREKISSLIPLHK